MSEATPETQTDNQEPAARPDSVPEQFWDAENGAVKLDDFAASYADLAQQAQVRSEALALIPEKPEDYEIALPEGFEAPEGFEFSVGEDERADAFRGWAHKHGVTPDAVKDLMGIYAAEQVSAHSTYSEEMAKLGSDPKARISDLAVAVTARVGEDGRALVAGLDSAAAVAALEKLIAGSSAAAPSAHQQSSAQDEEIWKLPPHERAFIQAQKR